MPNYIPVETDAGTIAGRDAIILDSIRLPDERKLVLTGSLNSDLCDGLTQIDHSVNFKLSFGGVVWLKLTELDFADAESSENCDIPYRESCFVISQNSELVVSFRDADHSSKITDNHKHYVLATYDTVFELIANEFKMKLEDSQPE